MHCPWSHLRRTLSGILLCEARTFLSRPLSVLPAAIAYSTYRIPHMISHEGRLVYLFCDTRMILHLTLIACILRTGTKHAKRTIGSGGWKREHSCGCESPCLSALCTSPEGHWNKVREFWRSTRNKRRSAEDFRDVFACIIRFCPHPIELQLLTHRNSFPR